MEAARLTYREEGAAKGKSEIQAPLSQPWTTQEVRELKTLAKRNTPTGVMSLKLERPENAIRSKAQREGIFTPTGQQVAV